MVLKNKWKVVKECFIKFIVISETYKKLVTFWDDVYGFKMSCMRNEVITEATTEIVKAECVCTEPGM